MSMSSWLRSITARILQPIQEAVVPVLTKSFHVFIPAPTVPPVVIDTAGWTEETPRWHRSGTRISYEGTGTSSLVSPYLEIPARRNATISVTRACDTWGPFEAKGYLVVNAYTDSEASGNQVLSITTPAAASGVASVFAEFPPTATRYTIALIAIPSYEGGTSDTKPLIPRFVNLAVS